MKGTWPPHNATLPTEAQPWPVLVHLNYAQRMVWLAELLGARVERDIRDPSDLPRLVVTFRQ